MMETRKLDIGLSDLGMCIFLGLWLHSCASQNRTLTIRFEKPEPGIVETIADLAKKPDQPGKTDE